MVHSKRAQLKFQIVNMALETHRTEHEENLKQQFGINGFYDEQWDVIQRVLKGERILMIQRTGFGKSLCYQYPATQFPGVTVVFSPLIALMRDQVMSLNRRGIPARIINSEQSIEDNARVIQEAMAGSIKILYIAPERQENQEWIEATRNMNLSMVVIDEAHTISVWGHDFRPAFRRIINLVRLLPNNLPVLATTATATRRVQQDIEQQIGGRLTTIRGSLVRMNFQLYVVKVSSEDEKMVWLAQNIAAMVGTGLVYTGTRINTEIYADWLLANGVRAVSYNAGHDAEKRKSIERGLMENKFKCVVSTNALGMGIDKPDIRFVIHTQIPASPVHYYQEIGRAGRDGEPTTVVLFYNNTTRVDGIEEDYNLPKAFIDSARPSKEKYLTAIEALKNEPLTDRGLAMTTNLKQTQIRVIKADLIDQGIVKEVDDGRHKLLEYQYGAKELDTSEFERIRQLRIQDLESMVRYVDTPMPRMQYLCEFLDDESQVTYSNCDNTNLEKWPVVMTDDWRKRINNFRENYFPVLDTQEESSRNQPDTGIRWTVRESDLGNIEILKDKVITDFLQLSDDDRLFVERLVDYHVARKSHMTNGIAASYYGASNVGSAIHRSKYANGGDFPNFLLNLTLKAFRRTFGNKAFDMVLYVPPTTSGDLVRNFAIKFAAAVGIPLSHGLVKIRPTSEQKTFHNTLLKKENVKEAFSYIEPDVVCGKRIILLDDIFDSGATMKEIGRVLSEMGAALIVPITIAKTVGGDL